jgi:hypothetical protein
MKFSDYAKAEGLELLREDIAFIRKRLLKMPSGLHRGILRHYVECWKDGMLKCRDALKTQNVGRQRANEYIFNITEDKNAKRDS